MSKTITKSEYETIAAIARRAQRMFRNAGVERDYLDCMMDIEAAHMDCGLKLEELAEADKFNFSHDVGGIANHLDRETGKLKDCFLPRYAT